MTDELKKVFPEQEYKLLSGETVTVSPVPFGKLRVFGEAVASVGTKLAPEEMAKIDDPSTLGKIMIVAFEEIIGIMALVLDKEKEWFDEIQIDDGIGLGLLIIEQNFPKDAKKKLQALMERIA